MRVSNSHFERSVVSGPVPEPMPSGAPELPVATARVPLSVAPGPGMLRILSARKEYEDVDIRAKTVVITGAGRGIGRALAIHFAGKGATLALLDTNRADVDETAAICAHEGAVV